MKIFEITLLFLGSVIGAGFATGAEIITFFGKLNLPVWCIACIVGITMLIIISGEILLYYPNNLKHTALRDFTAKKTSRLHKITNTTTILIYFILFTAMTAGITAITNSTFAILSLILSTVIVLFGFEKLSRLNIWLVLVIIILIITTSLPRFNLKLNKISNNSNTYWFQIIQGIISAFLYAGLNCFMFPELIKAVAIKNNKRTLIWAAITTAIVLSILVALIINTITYEQTTTESIPLLAAAPNFITIIIILLAILTSQYTALFAIMQRVLNLISIKKNRPLSKIVGITCICSLAFAISFCGFNQIINFAYPLIGAFTCFFLLISWLTSYFRSQV